jgi:hypothetical protein
MQYVITQADKRRQGSIVRQLWRFTSLSVRFIKLCRQCRSSSETRMSYSSDMRH